MEQEDIKKEYKNFYFNLNIRNNINNLSQILSVLSVYYESVELGKFNVGLGISAPPIAYKIDGKQYISLLVGRAYGAKTRRLITFSLGGEAKMPKLPLPFSPKPFILPKFKIYESLVSKGSDMYNYKDTYRCHGGGVISECTAPDLRASPIPMDKSLYNSGERRNKSKSWPASI